MWRFLLGLISGMIALLSLCGLALWTGAIDFAAKTPSSVEKSLAGFALEHSLDRRTPRTANPLSPTPEVYQEGLEHYRANCLPCHGAPHLEHAEFAEGLTPPAPDLERPRTQSRSDGELYWIIHEGIRMTAMPGFRSNHTTEEIWSMVAFVRHLNDLTPEEEDSLQAPTTPEEHEHEHHVEHAELSVGPKGPRP